MDDQGEQSVGVNSYALVSYLSGPLAQFLEDLRAQLSHGCTARAHITVLPPRPITGSSADAWKMLSEQLQDFPPFIVELGDVEIFRQSQVIYVAVKTGHAALEKMHRTLNAGPVAFEEPFPYHPHVTLAQGSAQVVPPWQTRPGPHGVVGQLTAVQVPPTGLEQV